jgi:choline kinase
VAIVTGHRADLVATFVEGRDWGVAVTCVHNAEYATSNNVVSFLAAADELEGGGYLLNSDIVFDPSVLADLVAAETGAYLVVDSDEPLGAEEMKVQLDDAGYIRRVSKLLPPETSAGEYIGITRLDSAAAVAAIDAARALVSEGRSDMYYEDAFDRAAAEMHLRPFPTRLRAWTEIDDVADHERALGVAATLDTPRG